MSMLLEAVGLSRTYPSLPPVEALSAVSLEVRAGERVAVIGRSGSGKSTLLNLLGILDAPTSGHVKVMGRDPSALSERQRDRLRADAMGFVFQESHVLGHRTVVENLEIRLSVNRVPRVDRARLCNEALERVQLSHRASSLGRLLSGGEKQRVAIARATITQPALILADEPTGNLDPESADAILELFDAQASRGVGVVVITHDGRIATWADRVLRLSDGRLEPENA
ncbi:ABC transporter ATP-binding protein [Actinotalea sp. C106]|uniref:ABC transporter ATP-binding protein n=1 Tax=Actinotalea sp. C106 TaxID=2908644 RepID=UPI0020296E59|nr:ABC transporter ATP-binding protein [Actinotalea sp. C106]